MANSSSDMEQDAEKQVSRRRAVRNVALSVLFAAALIAVVIFSVPEFVPIGDETAKRLTMDVVPRFSVAVFLIFLLLCTDLRTYLVPKKRGILFAVPCLFVALANFPYTALAGGSAVVDRTDLLWLFLLKCAAVALMEELFFRAVLVPVVRERLKGRYADFLTVLITAAVFGLVHLLNLFFGAGVGATFLQAGYTFLLGAMFAVLLMKTGHVWLCVLVHFLFDVGGVLIPDLGHGAFQDATFWALTAVFGVLCAVHIIWELVKRTRAARTENEKE